MEHEFQIRGIRLNEVHFSLMKEFQWRANEPIEINHRVDIDYTVKDKVLQVILSVAAMSENQPFRFSISWEGFFVFEEVPPKKDLDRVAHVHCSSIIFPFARESIADLTRRSGIPPFHLPPFNFVALYEERQKSDLGKASMKTPRKGRKTKT
jgi:preprotein translocase subunit SecB